VPGRRPWLVAAAAALALAGCGGDDEGGEEAQETAPAPAVEEEPSRDAPASGADGESTEPENGRVTVEMREFAFEPATVRAGEGTTIEATNVGEVAHNLTVEREQGERLTGTPTTDPGQGASVTLRLEPGTYTIVCTVPGHRDAGMVGKLVVR
jgi:plastocyanin